MEERRHTDDSMPLALPCVVARFIHDDRRTAVYLKGAAEELLNAPTDTFTSGTLNLGDLIHPADANRVKARLCEAANAEESYTVEYRIQLPNGNVVGVVENGNPSTHLDGQASFDAVLLVSGEWGKSLDDQLSAIVAISSDPAATSGDLIAALPRITETAAQFVDCCRVSVWLLSDDGQELVLLDLYNKSDQSHSDDLRLRCASYPKYFQALRHQRLIAANSAWTDPRTSEFAANYLIPLDIHSMLDATIRLEGEPVGVVCFEQVGQPRAWRTHEIHFAGEVADQITQILLYKDRKRFLIEQDTLRDKLIQAQKLEAVGAFAGSIAHDFNNFLAAIYGCSELLIEGMVTDSDEQLSVLKDIKETAKRASELTRQLLNFSNKHPMELEVIDLNKVVSEMSRMLERLVPPKINFELVQAKQALPVRGNANQLEQIVTNLVVNGRDAIAGSGDLRLEISQRTIAKAFTALTGEATPGNYAVIRMTDSGCGIPDHVLNEIFHPFFTTKKAKGGTGLGLSTVYGILSQWQSHVVVNTKVGRGTCFEILVPLLDQIDSARTDDLTEGVKKAGAGKILLVEDETIIRNTTTRLLKYLGYQVHAVENAMAAMDVLRGPTVIDLVLTDLCMPEIDGAELARWITEERPELPIVFMTGFRDPESALDQFDFPIIDKPFTAATLSTHLKAALGR